MAVAKAGRVPGLRRFRARAGAFVADGGHARAIV